MATQVTLGSGVIDSASGLKLRTNGTTEAVDISTAQVATLAKDAVVNGLTVGRGAGAVSTNTAVGASALAANQAGGTNNTAIGNAALDANTTGDENTAIGGDALGANTTASNNTAVGYVSSYSNTTGTNLVSVGRYSLYGNTTGGNNTAIGHGALEANTTASNNTAVGYQAGYSNQTGEYNTYLGWSAGRSHVNTTTAGSVMIGAAAGYNVTTGGSNTFLGVDSGSAITTGSKNTILGRYNGNQGGLDIRTASNYIVLSDGDGNPRGYFDNSGIFIVGAASANSGAFLNPNGSRGTGNTAAATGWAFDTFYRSGVSIGSITQSGTTAVLYNTASDQRLKENIQDAESASSLIDSLQVRQFDWKSDNSHQRYGFIAQELVSVAPEAVHQPTDTEQMMAVDYSKLVPMLVKEIQSLRKRLSVLESA